MKLLNFTIIKLTACLILGIVIGYYFEISVFNSIVLTSVLLGVLAISFFIAKKQFRKTVWFGIAAFLSMTSIGVLTTSLHNQKHFSNHYSHYISTENSHLNTATFRIREVLKPNRYYQKYVVDILKIEGQNTSGKCLLSIPKDSLALTLKIDAVFITKTVFQDVYKPLNPHQFNYKNYLEKKYIYHQLTLNENELFEVNSNTTTLLGYADAIRSHINKKLKPFEFNPDELAIINALLLGQRQDISEAVYNSYANAGVIHILAVSGLHVGIILLIFNFVLKPLEQLKHGKLIKTVLLVALLWSFALIAGLSASVTRAVTMFSILAIAINLKRPTNTYNTLAISMFVILLFKPLFIFDVGFQLSYLAVFAIVSIDPHLYKLWQPKYWLTDKLWHTLTITISAQFGILPLSLYYFHQFPGLFFVSNLIIVPGLGILLGLGIILILLAVLNILPPFFADFFGWIISLMNTVVDWVAQQESFLFQNIPFGIWHVLAFYVLIMAAFKFFFRRHVANLKFVLIGILCIQAAFIYTEFNKPTNELVVFHKSRHSLLGNTTTNKIFVAEDLDSISGLKINSIADYSVGNFIKTIETDSLRPVYTLNGKILLVVDSLGVYNVKGFKPDYVLLRQSPKINLNRLIDSIKPKQIIADGSNYKSYIKHWEQICKKRKLPFHFTGKNGAFTIKY